MSEQDNVARLKRAVNSDLCDATIAYISELENRVDALETIVDSLKRGFPMHHKSGERDPRYHADWHERDIESYEDRKDVTKKLLVAVLTSIVIGVGGGVWYLVQTGAKVEMSRAVKGAEK